MRVILALFALLLAAGLAGVLYLLFRSRPLQTLVVSPELVNIVSLAVNLALFAITIVALIVAIVTYQSAEESSVKQQKTLDSSRQALDSVVGVAEKQQALLDRALNVSETHLKLAEIQRAEELERRGRRPKLEVALGQISANDLRSGKRFSVMPNAQRVIPLGFRLDNVGDAPVIRPVMVIRAFPETVSLYQEGKRGGSRQNANIFQFSGPNILDLLPRTQNPDGYRMTVDAVIPETVTTLDLEVTFHGETLAAQTLKIGLDVVTSESKPPVKKDARLWHPWLRINRVCA